MEYDDIMNLLKKIRRDKLLVIVEGKKDKKALEKVGIKKVRILKKPLFQLVEDIGDEAEVVLLVDLDRQGKKIYRTLRKDLASFGVKVNNQLREYLFRNTKLRQIEGLNSYLEKIKFRKVFKEKSRRGVYGDNESSLGK